MSHLKIVAPHEAREKLIEDGSVIVQGRGRFSREAHARLAELGFKVTPPRDRRKTEEL